MKKIALLSLSLLLSLGMFSQQDPQAKKLLNEVSAKVKSYQNMYIDFDYILQNTAENIEQKTRGEVSLQEEKYRLNLMGAIRLFDGEKLYTIIPEDEEITISAYNAADDKDITPSKMLTFYEKGYNYKWDIVQNVKGRKIQYIKLSPIDSNAEIKDILLGIDQQTKHIYKLIQTQDNGTRITIKVNSFKTNQPLSPNLFNFDKSKYQGYYINELD